MDNAYIQVLADGTGIVVTQDFDMVLVSLRNHASWHT